MTSALLTSYLKTIGKDFLWILTCRVVPNLPTGGLMHLFAITRAQANFFQFGLGGTTLGIYA
jgi:hypothetical protein